MKKQKIIFKLGAVLLTTSAMAVAITVPLVSCGEPTTDIVIKTIEIEDVTDDFVVDGSYSIDVTKFIYKNEKGEMIPFDKVPVGNYTYTSSDENVATVNAEGIITYVDSGSTTINVKYLANKDLADPIEASFDLILKEAEPVVSEKSYIILNDGEEFELPATQTNINALCSRNEDNFENLDFVYEFENEEYQSKGIAPSDIKELVFGKDWLDVKELDDNFCYGMFSFREDLTSTNVDFSGLNNVTKVGDNFCSRMFCKCTELANMDTKFNLPQNITEVGTYFCFSMFSYCTNLEMNEVFNLPKKITTIGKHNFCTSMFLSCTDLKMNKVFNLPQKIINTDSTNFCLGMFKSCTNISSSSEEGTSIFFKYEAINAFKNVESSRYDASNPLTDGTVPANTTIKILP